MKKKLFFVSLIPCVLFAVAGCQSGNNNTTINSTQPITTTVLPPISITESTTNTSNSVTTTGEEELDYVENNVKIYREKDVFDKTIKLRFYEDTPSIPYISVSDYYMEFFKTDLTLNKVNNLYKYKNPYGGELSLETEEDILYIYDITKFSHHPDFKESTSKTFLEKKDETLTPLHHRAIALSDYNIDVHGDMEAYVPLALLSSFSGGLDGYNVSYNGKDIYVFDLHAQLSNETRDYEYFKTSQEYMSVFEDLNTPRSEDMALYNYGQLCFNFDNLRGYTAQLVFGDNNLLTLGLDGLLTKFYPDIKEMLLSTDKKEYYTGYYCLFNGLADGGHTGAFNTMDDYVKESVEDCLSEISDFTKSMVRRNMTSAMTKDKIGTAVTASKKAAFPTYDKATNPNLYTFDSATKTAYISFDKFIVDYTGWDDYYKNGMHEEDIPEYTDTFAFIRKSLYQAVSDEARNVVIDLTTNGGGDSGALAGIVGLLNGAKFDFVMNNTFDKNSVTTSMLIDVNLDGVCDEDDIVECNKFKFNVAVLTTCNAFSCGNLLPSVLKELGCKILGQRSGGGSCAISIESTADGMPYVRSSHHCLSNAMGENIDVGVPLDYEIQYLYDGVYNFDKFFDFTTINDYFISIGLAPEEL